MLRKVMTTAVAAILLGSATLLAGSATATAALARGDHAGRGGMTVLGVPRDAAHLNGAPYRDAHGGRLAYGYDGGSWTGRLNGYNASCYPNWWVHPPRDGWRAFCSWPYFFVP